MKKGIVFIGLFLITYSGYAQDKKALLGKWLFKEVYQKETVAPEKLAQINMMFNGMTIDFNENEASLTMMERTEPAKWHFSEDDPTTIVVTSKTGKVTELKIVQLNEKQLIIGFGKIATFVLDKG